jgi:outer membrane receptor protein involved in Fe transport
VKSSVLTLFILFSVASAQEDVFQQLFIDGNDSYADSLWSEAIAKYDSILTNGFHHSDLYYNLGNAYYQSEMFGGQPDTAAGFNTDTNEYSIVVPDYDVVNLFANYYYSDALTFRVNVGNLFDKEYWTAAYRSGSFMYIGDGRNITGTLSYEF